MKFQKGHKFWDNPNSRRQQFKKGHKHSNKTIEKIKNTKKTQYKEGKLKTTFEKGMKPFKYWTGKRRPEISGKNHYNWQGGVTSLNEKLRKQSVWKIWREAVFLRDNFTCQNPNCGFCNNKVGGVLLHPHHIKPVFLFPDLVFKVDNGVTYCAEFHLKSGLHIFKFKEIER